MINYQKPVIAVEWLKRYLLKVGYSKEQIIKAAGIDKNCTAASLKVIPYPNLLILLEWLALDQNNPDLGFDLCLISEPGDFGPVTLMAYQTPTLKDFFETMIKYQPLITSAIKMDLIVGSVETKLTYNLKVPSRPGCRVDIDYSLKMFIDLFREGIASDWRPLRTKLTYSEPEDITRLHQEFGSNILFDQVSNSIYFDSFLLDTPINDTDPRLLELMQNEIHQLLKGINQNADLLTQIRACIASSLASGNCNSNNIARHLNLSQRSMVRHLATLGTSLREIKADIIEGLSKTALCKTQSSIYEISIQMGFSETSAFDRMFKKKTGYTPIQYREKFSSFTNKMSHLY